ncbi:TetR/AcrR family transcriptional regulator C-terminal domain-containing protein [Streptomyces sp. NPDC051907]|uniref:TetR/AcrR family transcriptional regulator C-terminal domain-containing protein n=1 Tax=Streptomyces sp. NPDC051907 TaxID=3155284 RepID=UPI00342017EF
MPDPSPGQPPTGPAREPLSRARIIDAALRIIDDEGADALSMRRLAATLGVQAMSLYNHVSGKADIIEGVAEFITADMALPRRFDGGWEAGIRNIAHAFRQTSLRHPRACELVLTRQLSSPTILAPIDCSLSVLLNDGFDETTAVHVLRLVIAFQVGSLLREFHPASEFAGQEETDARELEAKLAGSGFPSVAKVAPILAVIDHEAEFTFGLETLISGLRPYAPQLTRQKQQSRRN